MYVYAKPDLWNLVIKAHNAAKSLHTNVLIREMWGMSPNSHFCGPFPGTLDIIVKSMKLY